MHAFDMALRDSIAGVPSKTTLTLCCIKQQTFIGTAYRERETLLLFRPPRGCSRCLTPIRVSAKMYSQAFLDKHGNTTNVILPHELKHGSCMLSKQALISVTNILQPWALKHNMLFITRVFTNTQCAYPMQPGDTLHDRRNSSGISCAGWAAVGRP